MLICSSRGGESGKGVNPSQFSVFSKISRDNTPRSPKLGGVNLVLGIQGVTREILENIGANLCNLVHFGDVGSSKVGRKTDAFLSHF